MLNHCYIYRIRFKYNNISLISLVFIVKKKRGRRHPFFAFNFSIISPRAPLDSGHRLGSRGHRQLRCFAAVYAVILN